MYVRKYACTHHIYKRFGEVTASTVSKCDSEPETQISPKTDPRMMSERFRAAVRKCLEFIGEVPNHGNFRKWDRFIDWYALARSIDHPTRLALYHTRMAGDNICEIMGRPEVGAKEIVACSESEATRILKKESKVFIRWW